MSRLEFDIRFRRGNFNLAANFAVADGLTLLIGPNGSGKSSLLRLLAGLEQPQSGRITIGEQLLVDSEKRLNLQPARRNIGMLFQELALFPHLDVAGNVAFGLKARGLDATSRRRKVAEILERFELTKYATNRISQLSQGERQKVALARALVTAPQLLLLDEPTAALDQESRWQFRRWLSEILRDWQIPILMATHDPADTAYFRKRILLLEDGKIRQHGSYHQLLHAPTTAFVADFAGVNYLLGNVRKEQGKLLFRSLGGSTFLAPFETVGEGQACLTVFPWDVSLFREKPDGSPRNHLYGEIQDVIILGDRVRITLVKADKLVAEISARGYLALGEPQSGEMLWAVFKARESRIENCEEIR
jgi:ABC-type sulfate/molybdate transport systems ATPase subunit